MTVTAQGERERLYDALLKAAASGPMVGALLTEIARTYEADVPVVVAAMWDLVEQRQLEYGADARVRRVDTQE